MERIKLRINIGDICFLTAMSLTVAFPNPSVFKAIAIVVFFGYMLLLSLGYGINTKNTLQYVWAIGFFVFCQFSKRWSVMPDAADEVLNNVQWSLLLSVAIVNYIIVYKLDAFDIIKRMLFVALVFLVNVVLNGQYNGGRFTVTIAGYALNENVFGLIAVGLACYMLYWLKKQKKKSTLLIILLGVLALLALISGSRKVLISLVAYVIIFLMYEYPPADFIKQFVRPFVVVAIAGVAFLCVMNIEVLYNSIGVRIESLFDAMSGNLAVDSSAYTRIRMIEKAYEIFRENPWIGRGINTFAHTAGFGAYAHNNYMELLANMGLMGFLIYYVPLFMYLRKAFVSWKCGYAHSVLPLAIIGLTLVNDFGAVSYASMVMQAFLALGIGMCISVSSQKIKV